MLNNYQLISLALITYLNKGWDPLLMDLWLEQFYLAEWGVPFVLKTKGGTYDILVKAYYDFRIEYMEYKDNRVKVIDPIINRFEVNKVWYLDHDFIKISKIFFYDDLTQWSKSFSNSFFKIKIEECPVYDAWTNEWITFTPIPWKWDNEDQNYPVVQTIDFLEIEIKTRGRSYELNIHPYAIIGFGVIFTFLLACLK